MSTMNESGLVAAGYHKTSDTVWQRKSAETYDYMETQAYGGGSVSAVKAGLMNTITSVADSISLEFNSSAFRAGTTFRSPQTPREIREFHEQELAAQIGEALQAQQVALNSLTDSQNQRLSAERNYSKANTVSPINYAQTTLALQNAYALELNRNIAYANSTILFIETDIMYNNSKIWWPANDAERIQGEAYVANRSKDIIPFKTSVSNWQQALSTTNAAIAQTNKDIKSIQNGSVPAKYQYSSETQKTLDAIQQVSDFYTDITQRYGIIASNKATLLANAAKGKTIKNAAQAIAVWDRYGTAINAKFSASDRAAISNALQAMDQAEVVQKLSVMQRGFGVASKFVDVATLTNEISKAVQTGNWHPVFIKFETLLAGALASQLLAYYFAALIVSPMGVLLFAVLLASASAAIDESALEELNSFISSL